MSHDHDMTVSQMHWQPALIRLTQIANPDCDEGKATPCFVNPQHITQISRGVTSFTKTINGVVPPEGMREYHPAQACTFVVISAGLGLQVVESPEQVALMRDRALGHEVKPKKV